MDKYINYYGILGLNPLATAKQIKVAYYKMSKELHPDKGGNEDEFKKITDAYKVLSDVSTRKLYDIKSKFGGSYSEFSELYDYEFKNDAKNYSKDKYDDFLKRDQLNILVYVDETFNGSVEYERWVYCKECKGSGMDSKAKINIGGAISEVYYFDTEQEVEEFVKDENIISYKSDNVSSVEMLIKLERLFSSGNISSEEYYDQKNKYEKQDNYICLSVKRKPKVNFFDLSDECEYCDGVGKWGDIDCFYCSGSGTINASKCKSCKGDKRILGKQTLSNITIPDKQKDYKIEFMGNFSRDIPGKSGNLWIIKKEL